MKEFENDLFRDRSSLRGNSITKFEFNPKKTVERDEQGRIVSEFTEFYLDGHKDKTWNIIDILWGIKEIAGTFEEEVYVSEKCNVDVRTYSEATDLLEKPRVKAIYVEDNSGPQPKAVVYFPYLRISEQEMVKAIDSVIERTQTEFSKGIGRLKNPKRIPIPQSVRSKVLVRAKGECEKCHLNLRNVKPNFHHKDGDPRNNKPSNLIVLCPNCHSNTRTYKNPKTKFKEKNSVSG